MRTSSPAPTAALDLVRLGGLMARTSGAPGTLVAVVDGPVALDHPDLADARIATVGPAAPACSPSPGSACAHGTFVAGILAARRTSGAPAICPDCTLLARPIFGDLPAATPAELSTAILDCVDAGARVINLSAATGRPTTRVEDQLRQALDHAVRRGAIVVAAAGNQGTLGSSEIIRHPGVIPVVAYDLAGRPTAQTNLGRSAGRWGLGAPGAEITSLAPDGGLTTGAGTSAAAAFVTGAIALLWSLFPAATAAHVRQALAHGPRRVAVVPPLLDAERAYECLALTAAGRDA